ncbi:MAG: GNAT family N-acetyltransferase [Proteobacteria bacterium]|nr:GNAT family N-acetyltransferase [Pseudomonadota bacterium]
MTTATTNPITLAAITADDYQDWSVLYHGYADFYQQPMNDTILQQTWQFLNNKNLHGAIARDTHRAIGIAHWEYILRPLLGMSLCYLHDLYITDDKRCQGAGSQLLRYVGKQAQQNNCSQMRWLTKEDNHTARSLYDKVATATTEWVVYQQTIRHD